MSRFPTEENVTKSVPEICPLSGLPLCIAGAVSEVHEKVKAPISLVIASALGAISLACQDEIDVESGSGEIGPCSLFFLTVAESGDHVFIIFFPNFQACWLSICDHKDLFIGVAAFA